MVARPRTQRGARAHAPSAGRTLTFGPDSGADVRVLSWTAVDARSRVELEVLGVARTLDLPMLGAHNALDACAAIAAAIAVGVPLDTALDGLARVRPAAMRSEIAVIAGRNVIVDCYNANPDSMRAALDLLQTVSAGRRKIAVLGDMLELGDRSEREHAAIGGRARELAIPVITLGAWKEVVAAAADSPSTTDDPAEAARRALAMTAPGDWILVKASRGMRLERVVEALRTCDGEAGASGQVAGRPGVPAGAPGGAA